MAGDAALAQSSPRLWTRPLVLALLLCAARASEPCAGAQEISAETRAARAHFVAGQAYYQKGELRRALEEFRAAQRDQARAELEYNIGLVYDRLGDAARAIDAYRLFLERMPHSAERPTLEARIGSLERSVGELVIVSHVLGAELTLDEERLDQRALGRPLRMTEGPHAVGATKEGYLSRRRMARVEAGKRIVVELDPEAPQRGLSRRAKIGLGVGLSGAVLLIGGLALGLSFGLRSAEPIDPGGRAGVVVVRPLALGSAR